MGGIARVPAELANGMTMSLGEAVQRGFVVVRTTGGRIWTAEGSTIEWTTDCDPTDFTPKDDGAT